MWSSLVPEGGVSRQITRQYGVEGRQDLGTRCWKIDLDDGVPAGSFLVYLGNRPLISRFLFSGRVVNTLEFLRSYLGDFEKAKVQTQRSPPPLIVAEKSRD